MGMFDYINCKCPLPDVNLSGTSLVLDDLRNGNQTKDLDCSLRTYIIEEDRQISYIQYKTIKHIPPNKNATGFMGKFGSIEECDPETVYLKGNHVIEFGNFFTKDSDKYDYLWDFEAKIEEGKVTNIRLVRFEKVPNQQRKKTIVNIKEKIKKYTEYQKTFRYRYFFKYTRMFRFYLKRNVILFLQNLLNWTYKL